MAIPPTLGMVRVCEDLSLGLSTSPKLAPKSIKNLENSITAATKGGTYGNSAELIEWFSLFGLSKIGKICARHSKVKVMNTLCLD